MNFDAFFSKDLVFFLDVPTKEDVFKEMFDQMYQLGCVKASYLNALSEREKEYPTGIQTEHLGVAIPHTDAVHVNRESIGVAVLKKPVSFSHMGMPEQNVEVEIIFMLAIQKPDRQLGVLQIITGLMQNKEMLKRIHSAESPAEIISVIQEYSRELNV